MLLMMNSVILMCKKTGGMALLQIRRVMSTTPKGVRDMIYHFYISILKVFSLCTELRGKHLHLPLLPPRSGREEGAALYEDGGSVRGEVQQVMGPWDKAGVESTVHHGPGLLITSKGRR